MFTAITITLKILVVYSNPTPEIDFRTIFELLGQRALKKDRKASLEMNYELTSREDVNNFGAKINREILKLIQKSTDDKDSNRQDDKSDSKELDDDENRFQNGYKSKKETDVITFGHYDKHAESNENKLNTEDGYENDARNENNDARYRDSRFNKQALEELLSQNVLDKKYRNKPRNKLIPNNLVGSYLNNYKSDSNNDAGEYSKVYIILNPKAIQKSKNKEELNNL